MEGRSGADRAENASNFSDTCMYDDRGQAALADFEAAGMYVMKMPMFYSPFRTSVEKLWINGISGEVLNFSENKRTNSVSCKA